MRTDKPYLMRGHFVAPMSAVAIRRRAEKNRATLQIQPKFDLWQFLEGLSVNFGVVYEIVDDNSMPGSEEAYCMPSAATILIPNRSLEGINNNSSRSRFTICHELGHFVLAHQPVMHREVMTPAAYVDSEWQADVYAAELLMPADVIKNDPDLHTPTSIAQNFGVSFSAASIRVRDLRKQGLI